MTITQDRVVTANCALQGCAPTAGAGEDGRLEAATRQIGQAVGGQRGTWVYQVFDAINGRYFGGAIPTPLIIWSITEWSACIGKTARTTPALITLHPTLLGCGNPDLETVWKIPVRHLGTTMAFDTLLHECIHAYIDARWGGWHGHGESSHNNDLWVAEVNRLAPLLGLPVVAGRSTTARVPIPDAPPTARGKQRTRVQRVSTGDVPFKAVAGFPRDVRYHLGLTGWYEENRPRFPAVPQPGICHTQLDVTKSDGGRGDDPPPPRAKETYA